MQASHEDCSDGISTMAHMVIRLGLKLTFPSIACAEALRFGRLIWWLALLHTIAWIERLDPGASC